MYKSLLLAIICTLSSSGLFAQTRALIEDKTDKTQADSMCFNLKKGVLVVALETHYKSVGALELREKDPAFAGRKPAIKNMKEQLFLDAAEINRALYQNFNDTTVFDFSEVRFVLDSNIQHLKNPQHTQPSPFLVWRDSTWQTSEWGDFTDSTFYLVLQYQTKDMTRNLDFDVFRVRHATQKVHAPFPFYVRINFPPFKLVTEAVYTRSFNKGAKRLNKKLGKFYLHAQKRAWKQKMQAEKAQAKTE